MLTQESKTKLNEISSVWKTKIAAAKLNNASDHLLLTLTKFNIISKDLNLSEEDKTTYLEAKLKQTFATHSERSVKTLSDLLKTFSLYLFGTLHDCKIAHFDSYIEVDKNELAATVQDAIKVVRSW